MVRERARKREREETRKVEKNGREVDRSSSKTMNDSRNKQKANHQDTTLVTAVVVVTA